MTIAEVLFHLVAGGVLQGNPEGERTIHRIQREDLIIRRQPDSTRAFIRYPLIRVIHGVAAITRRAYQSTGSAE
jgi:hypothetical protein